MADDPFRVYSISNNLKDFASEHLKLVHDAIERSREILKGNLPDTFLGRKSQEPFANEEEE